MTRSCRRFASGRTVPVLPRHRRIAWSVLVAPLVIAFQFGAVGGPALAQAAVEPVITVVDTSASVRLEVQGRDPVVLSDPSAASGSLSGTESSECADYGRASFARGSADTALQTSEPTRIRLSLRSNLSVNGGHFRTCGTCFQNKCLAIHGNDTKARASSRLAATLRVALPDVERPGSWYLETNLSNPDPSLKISLIGPDGSEVAPLADDSKRYVLAGRARDEFFVNVAWSQDAENEGGCCNDTTEGAIALTARLEPGPQLYAAGVEPFIVGGKPTPAFQSVGALRLDGLSHCTGTLVSDRTILTAAHCVAGYEDHIADGRMSFSIGRSVDDPQAVKPIIGSDYPRNTPAGFKYNHATLEDDVGLVFVEAPFDGLRPANLHSGQPRWDAFADNPLTFVGYGYNRIQGDLVGVGVKREASWTVDEVHNRTVRWSFSERSTCKADSGGPAFYIRATSMLLVAVTSSGNAACTQGTNMRVDSYLPWIETRLR